MDLFPDPMRMAMDEAVNQGGKGGEVVPPAAANLRIVSITGLEVAGKGWEGIRD